jgi:hypothetical protein
MSRQAYDNLRSRVRTSATPIKGYHMRLADEDKIEIFLKHHGRFWVQRSGRIKVKPSLCPRRVIATIGPDDATFTNQYQYEPTGWVFSPEFSAAAKAAGVTDEMLAAHSRMHPPHYGACNGFNNILEFFDLYNCTNGDPVKPGVLWHNNGTKTNIVGPVHFKYEGRVLTPLWDQPEKIENKDQRKANNAAIRNAFKRVKALERLGGIKVTDDDIKQYLGVVTTPYNLAVDSNWNRAEDFLRFATNFDPQQHQDTVELTIRAAALSTARWYWGSSIARCGDLTEPAVKRRVRDTLHRKLEVVAYR